MFESQYSRQYLLSEALGVEREMNTNSIRGRIFDQGPISDIEL